MMHVMRPVMESDGLFLAELFADVRGPELQLGGIPEPMVESLLAMQFRGQRLSYAAQYPDAVDRIVMLGEERAGRLLVSYGTDGICLVDVALLSRYRGQGTGTALVRELCREAEASSRRLHLSVRGGSRARRLYEREGLVAVGSDEAYITMEWRGDTAATAAGSPQTAEEQGEGLNQGVSPGLTRAYFETLVGAVVKLYALDLPGRPRGAVELTVDAVESLPVVSCGAKVEPGDSFTVRLHGPLQPVLLHECAELEPAGVERMVVFLTPLGIEQGAMQYEIIFNRSRPV